ncbi:MAG TPA: aldo/keto reductase [Chitinophagaceae bacterium]|nr:aldo/keto reductase [Chitinophagaceae bacterium]
MNLIERIVLKGILTSVSARLYFVFTLAWLLAQKPWIVPIPGTTKLAHLQENLWSIDFEFTPDELKTLTEEVSKIKIVGDRYTGAQAEQTKK